MKPLQVVRRSPVPQNRRGCLSDRNRRGKVEKVPLLCCHQGFADTRKVVSYTMNIHDIQLPQGAAGQ